MKQKWMVFACAAVLFAMAGCSASEPVHTHTPLEGWERNGTEHWKLCECGEKLDTAAHELDDADLCSICGSEVLDWGDGTLDVTDYDEHGNTTRSSSFSKGGELLQEYIYNREYDADGNLMVETVFCDGVLTTENRYTTDENGTWQNGYVDYYEDGTVTDVEYNPDGEIIRTRFFDEDGKLESESTSEYAYTDEGESYESVYTETLADGTKGYVEYNQYGDVVKREYWNPDGSLQFSEVYEYDYDEDGNRLWIKEYRDGVLTFEVLNYAEGSDGEGSYWRYPENTIDYYEDGSRLLTYYGVDTEVAKETFCGADGTVKWEFRYIYEYDDEGNRTHAAVYENDWLSRETEYALDSDGWTYKCRETEYLSTGEKIVREFDEMEELISETSYGKG